MISKINSSTKRLFVGSLPYKYTEGQLLSLFVPYGKVVSVRIMHTRWGKSRGLGYVEFDELSSAVEAKQKMNGYPLEDRTIIVDFAQPDPLLTPEGRQRFEEAEERRQRKRNKFGGISKTNRNPNEQKPQPQYFPKKGKRIRQSVFEQRAFGSRVGAKFAKRKKKLK